VFALLGPNGAGKTTTVEILEGFRDRTAGEVSVLGVDPARGDAAWKARIGIVLQSTGAFEELTVEETVRHFAELYPRPRDPGEVIAMVGLEAKRGSRGHDLSGGQKRRLDIALGLIGDPELIFLDEPTTGLDPVARRQTWDLVRGLAAGGKTVVLTTHYLDEAEALANRAGIIAGGKLIEVAPPRELGGRQNAEAQLRFKRRGTLEGRALPALESAEVSEKDGMVTIVTGRPTQVVSTLAGWATDAGLGELPELTVTRPSLEEIYLKMIESHGAKSASGEA
jgi:ABC-2 type transport system ATP-binding protein